MEVGVFQKFLKIFIDLDIYIYYSAVWLRLDDEMLTANNCEEPERQ